MNKDKEGQFPVPDAYNISGGAMFYNMFDDIWSIYRPNRHKDSHDRVAEAHPMKVKKKKLAGRPLKTTITFDIARNIYLDGYLQSEDEITPVKAFQMSDERKKLFYDDI